MQQSLIWPTKDPDEVLDYLLDATSQIAATSDGVLTAAVSISPSGPGEMTATQVIVSGSFITVWLGGGYAGRIYRIKIVLTTVRGATLEYPIIVPIDQTLAAYPIIPPVSADFGAATTWRSS